MALVIESAGVAQAVDALRKVDIALFMTLKRVGTMLGVAALPLFYSTRERIGMSIGLAIGKF